MHDQLRHCKLKLRHCELKVLWWVQLWKHEGWNSLIFFLKNERIVFLGPPGYGAPGPYGPGPAGPNLGGPLGDGEMPPSGCNPDSFKLYLSNVPKTWDIEELRSTLTPYGQVF